MTERMRWAILGTGKIANRFASALNNIPARTELLAVGSRNQETADAFADQYGISRRHVGYENVFADPEVDIVYVATPGVFHEEHVMKSLKAGKHVLCEKAFTINATQAKEIIDFARQNNLFLMEAMWTRFFPIHVRIRELLADGVIGDINGMLINFMAKTPKDPTNRFFDINLGAGVLLDLVSYGISWAFSLLGEPEAVTGLAHFDEGGADVQSGVLMRYKDGQLVSIVSSQISYDVKEAVLFGSHGKIEIHAPWYKPSCMTLHVEGKDPEIIEMPLGKYVGYEWEALAVMDCIQEGKTECDVMPLNETLAIMKVLDSIREQWGFSYPFE
jgi:dihydrodiol dehydrogenase / D-xylose 1-dehydrogenase (NADP)